MAENPTRVGVGGDARNAPHGRWGLPRPAVGLLLAFTLVTIGAWLVTILTATDLVDLLNAEVMGAAPIGHLSYFSLVAVMMAAMMLPSAVPMIASYHGLAKLDSSPAEGGVRSTIFTASYLVIWAGFAAVALIPIMYFGLMGGLSGPAVLVPGAILIAAGIYQFTSWKRYCLEGCQTPAGFLLRSWRSGRWSAIRLGASYAAYCLGCCWLLMLVVFVSGAMSLLWMGIFSGLVLFEKMGGSTSWFVRGMGVGAVSTGALVSFAAIGWIGFG